jgi:hypothetical protein
LPRPSRRCASSDPYNLPKGRSVDALDAHIAARALVSAIRAVMTGIWRADAQDVITQDLNNCCKIT